MFQTHLKSNRLPLYTQEHSETQLHTVIVAALENKALGFTRYLVDVACMEKTWFFYDFYGFGGIRSTRGPYSE